MISSDQTCLTQSERCPVWRPRTLFSFSHFPASIVSKIIPVCSPGHGKHHGADGSHFHGKLLPQCLLLCPHKAQDLQAKNILSINIYWLNLKCNFVYSPLGSRAERKFTLIWCGEALTTQKPTKYRPDSEMVSVRSHTYQDSCGPLVNSGMHALFPWLPLCEHWE